MLRDELVRKLGSLHKKMGELEGDDLVAAKGEFDELAQEIDRIDTVAKREAEAEHAKEVKDEDLWKTFGKLMRGEEVSDSARESLAIREDKLKDKAGEDAFRAPGNALEYFSPKMVQEAKRAALGVVSSDITEILVPQAQGPFVQMPFPPTPMFDAATKLTAINGVAVPFLKQTTSDPFAGVTIASGTSEGYAKTEDHPEVDDVDITTSEYNAYTIVSDLALRRAPMYESIIANVFRSALAYTVEQAIITALLADGNVNSVARQTALQVEWKDLVNLEAAIPWYWAVQGSYGLSQTVQAYLKGTLTSTPGYPMYNQTTANAMYTALNGRPFFLDELSTLGTSGDVVYGDFRNIFLGIGQDIVFRRSDQGLQLVKQNSTIFAIFAHIGIGIPMGGAFAKLDDVSTTTTTTGAA